jgi:hypothetical protein
MPQLRYISISILLIAHKKDRVLRMKTLLEILSFATCLMQLKNLTCNYFGVACNMCSCMQHFLVAKDKLQKTKFLVVKKTDGTFSYF